MVGGLPSVLSLGDLEKIPLAEAPAAYERFAAGSKLGKIVLET